MCLTSIYKAGWHPYASGDQRIRESKLGFAFPRRRRWRGPCVRRASILLPGRRMQESPQSKPPHSVGPNTGNSAEKTTKIPLKVGPKGNSAEKTTKIPLEWGPKGDLAEKLAKIPLEGGLKGDLAEKSAKIPLEGNGMTVKHRGRNCFRPLRLNRGCGQRDKARSLDCRCRIVETDDMANPITKFSPVHSRPLGPTGLRSCLRPRKTLTNDVGREKCTTGVYKADEAPYVRQKLFSAGENAGTLKAPAFSWTRNNFGGSANWPDTYSRH